MDFWRIFMMKNMGVKAKLIKTDLGYKLHVVGHELMGISQACYPWDITKMKLSINNCQDIERGYSLDELAKIECKHSSWKDLNHLVERGFKIGFQKQSEIKKFDDDDMLKAFFLGRESLNRAIITEEEARVLINQSLQQTQWDVEIVEEIISKTKTVGAVKGVKGSGNKIVTDEKKIKFDSEGCLILKQIIKNK